MEFKEPLICYVCICRNASDWWVYEITFASVCFRSSYLISKKCFKALNFWKWVSVSRKTPPLSSASSSFPLVSSIWISMWLILSPIFSNCPMRSENSLDLGKRIFLTGSLLDDVHQHLKFILEKKSCNSNFSVKLGTRVFIMWPWKELITTLWMWEA